MSSSRRKNSKASPRNTDAARRTRKVKVLILGGGISSEREVSLKTAAQIAEALSRKRYSSVSVEITKQGRWFIGGMRKTNPRELMAHPSRGSLDEFDAAFIGLHGKFGEDGRVQALLEMAGIPYTGSGVLASALGMDKVRTLQFAAHHGIRVPKQIVLGAMPRAGAAWTAWERKAIKEIGIPCVVKPNQSGSSIGVTIVKERRALRAAVAAAFREDQNVIVQQYIEGREITCGVIGNTGRTKVFPLPPVEIIAKGGFFDYRAKYLEAATQELCPAPIGARRTKQVQELAVQAHEMLGCDGATRSDFILAPDGKFYFLEINTIPGMTAASLLPKEAAAQGMGFGELLERLIELALEKHGGA